MEDISTQPPRKEDTKPRIYMDALNGFLNHTSNNKIRKENQQNFESTSIQNQNNFERSAPTRKFVSFGYQTLFLGHCFSCNNFGHKARDCKAYLNKDLLKIEQHR